jgi:hypothetical protein
MIRLRAVGSSISAFSSFAKDFASHCDNGAVIQLLRELLCGRLARYLAPRRSARGRRLYREDFFLAFFFPGIIFLAARFVVFAADLAAFFTVRTGRETTDFFFALLAIVYLPVFDLDFLAFFDAFFPAFSFGAVFSADFFARFTTFFVAFLSLGALIALAATLAAFLTGRGVLSLAAFVTRFATDFTALSASAPAAGPTSSANCSVIGFLDSSLLFVSSMGWASVRAS